MSRRVPGSGVGPTGSSPEEELLAVSPPDEDEDPVCLQATTPIPIARIIGIPRAIDLQYCFRRNGIIDFPPS